MVCFAHNPDRREGEAAWASAANLRVRHLLRICRTHLLQIRCKRALGEILRKIAYGNNLTIIHGEQAGVRHTAPSNEGKSDPTDVVLKTITDRP